MIIGTIKNLRAAQVNPGFLFESLTVGTIAVATGIIVYYFITAGTTGFKVEAAFECPADADMTDCALLLIREAE